MVAASPSNDKELPTTAAMISAIANDMNENSATLSKNCRKGERDKRKAKILQRKKKENMLPVRC